MRAFPRGTEAESEVSPRRTGSAPAATHLGRGKVAGPASSPGGKWEAWTWDRDSDEGSGQGMPVGHLQGDPVHGLREMLKEVTGLDFYLLPSPKIIQKQGVQAKTSVSASEFKPSPLLQRTVVRTLESYPLNKRVSAQC